MRLLSSIFEQNKAWAERVRAQDPDFFKKLSQQQSPEYLWIGCSDSRVPANEIMGLLPGEVFVHRNVANLVVHTDLNCLSAIQFAVDILKVKHVMVVGHYGCSGVRAVVTRARVGLSDNWLRHILDVEQKHSVRLAERADPAWKHDRLCELNVIEQVRNVCETTILHDAWERGEKVAVHGWIYGLQDGLLRDLDLCVSSLDEVEESYRQACNRLQRIVPGR